jgi:hypothetical protein
MLADGRIGVADQVTSEVGKFELLLFLVEKEVMVALHAPGQVVGPFINDRFLGRGVARRRGDNQRRAGFVDEDIVGFVDQGEMMAALNFWVAGPRHRSGGQPRREKRRRRHLAAFELQAVTQEIETEFAGGAIGDVLLVRHGPVLVLHFLLENADAEADRVVDVGRPVAVA